MSRLFLGFDEHGEVFDRETLVYRKVSEGYKAQVSQLHRLYRDNAPNDLERSSISSDAIAYSVGRRRVTSPAKTPARPVLNNATTAMKNKPKKMM